MKKIREYMKGKNPYMLASVAVVILSIGLISALLWDVPSAEDAGISVSAESSMEGSVDTQEAEVQTEEVWETEEIKEVFAETQQTEETVFENPEETAEESIPVSEEIRGSASATEESQEETESMEVSTEPESEEIPEEVLDLIPEKEHDEDQETVPKEETEEQPEAEVIPEPEVHEHSWIFESFYQEPTCSNGGLVTQICAKCGETQITGGTPTGEHSYEVESEGDCCSAEVMVCTECNFREVREMDPDNHIDVEDGFCYGCGKKTE